ncbi:MAG: WSD1 family O-acyltransferase, partial [Acidimicrobiia bacterium]|nr:WSD1 family O-acyltransferase [Acidimicrobiia bacterium]
SYQGRIMVSLHADGEAVPDLQVVAGGIAAAFNSLRPPLGPTGDGPLGGTVGGGEAPSASGPDGPAGRGQTSEGAD